MRPETHEVEAIEATALLPYDTDVESAKRYGRAARSPRTRIEYARDWSHFAHYCEHTGLAALPAAPQTVAAYLASLAGRVDRPLKATTIQRRAAAIAFQHRHHGHAPPTAHPLVADVLAGITREHGVAPQRKSALTIELLRCAPLTIRSTSCSSLRMASAFGTRRAAMA